jgi:signal transduction histidine kinase
MPRTRRDVALCLALALVYFGAARLGLVFATVSRSVTLVWPPSGLALAALVLLGSRLWPGVALGAFAVNALTPGVPLATAAGMAAGNTLEALAGAHLLRSMELSPSLDRLRDVLALVPAGLLSCVAAATAGTLSLWAGGVIGGDAIDAAWIAWWLGDLMGILLFAPLLLTLPSWAARAWPAARLLELGALGVALIVVTSAAFGLVPVIEGAEFPQSYAVFPLLLWAALRFGLCGAASANVLVSAVSVWATINGHGPFARASLQEALLFLQTFMLVAALTSLVLGALVAERDHAIGVRDEFMSIASHELNTPLTPLGLSLQQLARMIARGDVADPEAARRMAKWVAMADRQRDRLGRLVDGLLEVVRGRTDRLELQRQPVDLAVLVQETVAELSDELTASRCELELRTQPVTGEWDPERLRHVVANLLTNAMKYGQGQPVTVSVAAASARAARLQVADRGVGIEARNLERIFGPFERATSSRHVPGIGLGLHIVRQIVDAHGGTVAVDSAPGAGATFVVTLPLAPPSGRTRV